MKVKITYVDTDGYRFEYEGGELDGQEIAMSEEAFTLMVGGLEDHAGGKEMAKFLAEASALARKQPGVTIEVTSKS